MAEVDLAAGVGVSA